MPPKKIKAYIVHGKGYWVDAKGRSSGTEYIRADTITPPEVVNELVEKCRDVIEYYEADYDDPDWMKGMRKALAKYNESLD